jgi:tRNA-dihydrouridine synthase B
MLKIGSVELPGLPVLLAPMEDVTDSTFRHICKKSGADMMYTEFISADGLLHDGKKSLKKLAITDDERPIGIQIYGHETESMVAAVGMAEEAKPDLIDINFGCPVRKIANRGAGSGMMKYPDKMVEITAAIVKSTSLPVTVKTRLGWDENSKIIVELALRLQDAGIQAITIHGRTRGQMYTGQADWTLIGEVKHHPQIHIPVIGNGDIDSPQKAKEMFDRYEVDAIMVGRASVGKPWIFEEIRHYLQTGELLPEKSLLEKVAFVRDHFNKSVVDKGERVGILLMRRHFAQYFKGLPDFRDMRIRLLTALKVKDIHQVLDEIAGKYSSR